ncbi:hypothetical protein KQX54_020614 [Cotesia glomerata]|uniref:Uncharacterized protein n=1 Tax=Cotesia glomerata TaxID=32391 RepID=A0AAV7J6D4_COTGL|nr:hypothetical protein KQX54_020614 [Cotesia glomerata]
MLVVIELKPESVRAARRQTNPTNLWGRKRTTEGRQETVAYIIRPRPPPRFALGMHTIDKVCLNNFVLLWTLCGFQDIPTFDESIPGKAKEEGEIRSHCGPDDFLAASEKRSTKTR